MRLSELLKALRCRNRDARFSLRTRKKETNIEWSLVNKESKVAIAF